jgi:predicted dinucleotide-binding enzyme
MAFVFGYLGFREQARDHPEQFSRSAALYETLQMFVLHTPHIEERSDNLYLDAARWLAAATFLLAIVKAFWTVFRGEWIYLSLIWTRKHVVICGLGDMGLRLALEARRHDMCVVAIEKDGEPGTIEQARRSGVLVIESDACDAALLHKLRIERAEFVVAACREDQTNVAIAAIIGQLMPPALCRPKPLICRLLIQDFKLRELLADESIFPRRSNAASTRAPSNYRINFRDLHVKETAARQCFRRHPLDFRPIRESDDTVVHLVVIGFGAMGQSLALQAMRIGHFANEVSKGLRIRITVVDRDTKSGIKTFRARHPKAEQICEFIPHPADYTAPGFVDTAAQLSRDAVEPKELVTYAVCVETEMDAKQVADDRENLRIGIELSRRTDKRPVQTLIYQSTRYGFAALFPREDKGAGLSPRLHAFGMVEDIFTWDILLHESEDRLARALHEDYERRHPIEASSEWDGLAEAFKESNRQAADHIPVKLRALGYHDEPFQSDKQPIERFTENEVLLLAQMEHLRWCAERWLDDWEHGKETNREKKINKNLVLWAQLEEAERNKDPEQINAIIPSLNKVGRGIYLP